MKKMSDSWMVGGVLLAGVAAMLGITRGCNMACNNQTLSHPNHTTHSYATGIGGHIEYTTYSDGTSDIKRFPDLHRVYESEFFEEIDGDTKIDRIRTTGAEWRFNQLTEFLVREKDYSDNKKRFDQADALLQELQAKYRNE